MSLFDVFTIHGVSWSLIPEDEDQQAQGDCCFCGKRKHFYAKPSTGQWDCKHCGRSGNVNTFLRHVIEFNLEQTTEEDYRRLRDVRKGAISVQQFMRNQIAWNGKQWLIPVRSASGHLQDIRIYKEGGHPISTKGCKAGLWGVDRLVSSRKEGKRVVWICEGEWDGMALDGFFRREKIEGQIVVAVPGGNTFKNEWVPFFNDEDVILAGDADEAGDRMNEKVGFGNVQTGVVGLLSSNARRVRYLRWPLDVPEKYDVSDLIAENKKDRSKTLEILRSLVADAPRREKLEDTKQTEDKKKKRTKHARFGAVLDMYKKWFKMNHDAEMALRAMIAVVQSNGTSGEPLWLYIVAPPGAGKTAMLNPLRSIPELCVFRSTLTSHMLVSGFQTNTDPSLIPKLKGKTLVLKDMTEVLDMPEHLQKEVFSTLRGAYDGLVERSYGNAVYRRYECDFTIVAGVTVKIYGHSQANMGERMLKFQLVKHGKLNHEAQIDAAMMNAGREKVMDEELHEVMESFLSRKVDLEELNSYVDTKHWAWDRIKAISQIVERLRAEVERDFRGEIVKYKPQPGVATRLAKCLLKMARLLVLTSDTGEFTEKEWEVVERIAFDTAIGWNLDVVQAIMKINGGKKPISTRALVDGSGLPRSNVARRLEDLALLKVVRKEVYADAPRNEDRVMYRLDKRIVELWKRSGVKFDHVKRAVRVRKSRKYRIGTLRWKKPPIRKRKNGKVS